MIDYKLTAKLAQLCAIELSDEELLSAADDMADIISVMDKVKAFPSDTTEPVYRQMNFRDLRNDTYKESDADITSDTATMKNDCFVVPPLIREV